MPEAPRTRRRRPLAAVAAAAALLATGAGCDTAQPGAVQPPPAGADVDYQLGGAYAPPAGVRVVVRDREAAPAAGLYNVCYVNAFQAQPGADGQWDDDLLLTDEDGRPVVDRDWDEALLDISTPAKRRRVAAKVNAWIDGCAAKGYDAVEPDNYDSYTRSDGLLTARNAEDYITLLTTRAHARGLAIAQKNTADLAEDRSRTGLDFAVTEECATYDECATYTAAFGRHVIVVEYTDPGLKKACARWGNDLSIVRRDLDLVTPKDTGYVRATCASERD